MPWFFTVKKLLKGHYQIAISDQMDAIRRFLFLYFRGKNFIHLHATN
jgi:hypothetical protein